MLSLGMDVVVAVRVGICADVAPFCVGRAVIRSVGPPDRMQSSIPVVSRTPGLMPQLFRVPLRWFL